MYNSSSDSKTRGECSRYLLQLLGSKLYDIERIALSSHQSTAIAEIKEQPKNSKIIDILRQRFDISYSADARTMTPSAINKYIDCGLRFFYYYVMKMKPLQDVDEEFKDNDFGTVFHKAAEYMYEKIIADCNTSTMTASAFFPFNNRLKSLWTERKYISLYLPPIPKAKLPETNGILFL